MAQGCEVLQLLSQRGPQGPQGWGWHLPGHPEPEVSALSWEGQPVLGLNAGTPGGPGVTGLSDEHLPPGGVQRPLPPLPETPRRRERSTEGTSVVPLRAPGERGRRRQEPGVSAPRDRRHCRLQADFCAAAFPSRLPSVTCAASRAREKNGRHGVLATLRAETASDRATQTVVLEPQRPRGGSGKRLISNSAPSARRARGTRGRARRGSHRRQTPRQPTLPSDPLPRFK